MVTFGEASRLVVPFSAVEVKGVASGAGDTNVVAFGTILAVIFGVTKSGEVTFVTTLKVVVVSNVAGLVVEFVADVVAFSNICHAVVVFIVIRVTVFAVVSFGVTEPIKVAFRTTWKVVVALNSLGPVTVAFNVKGLKVVTFCAILSVVTIFIVTGSIDDAFPAGSTVVLSVAVTLDATNGPIVPPRSVAVADVTFGGRGHVSFCAIFPDVVYIVIGPTDDVFAANDTEVVFDDTGHAVGTLISREDGVVFDAEGADTVAFGARTDIVVVFCTTFSGVVFSSKGPTEVAFAVGSIGVVSIVVTFGETNHACLLYTSPSPRDRQKSRMPSSA